MRKLLLLFLVLFFSSGAFAACNYYLLEAQSNYSTLPANVFSGDIISLNVPLKNTSETCSAVDVNASIALNDNFFEAVNLSDNVSAVNANETKSVSFSFKVKDSAFPGTYKIPVKLQYTNVVTSVEETFELSLDVLACYSLDVKNISYSVDSVYAGEEVKVFADVENTCSGAARDVSVQLRPVTNSSFEPFIVLSGNLLQVGDILPGKSERVSFLLKPIADAEPKIYVFGVDANCFDCEKVFSDTVSFEVLAKPKLIFSGIDFSNESRSDAKDIFAGENFSFSVQLDNIGKEPAKAVKVSVSAGGGLAGSKENFVGNIDPDDSGSAVFDLSFLPNANAGEHKSVILVEYLDEKGAVQQVSEGYSFYVAQRPSDIFGWIVLLFLLIIVLVILYFLVKMVFRQLAMQKTKLR